MSYRSLNKLLSLTKLSHIKFLLVMVLLSFSAYAEASWFDAASIGIGKGEPNQLWGERISLFKQMGIDLHNTVGWRFQGYWDFNFAHWKTEGNAVPAGGHSVINIIGLNPVWRLSRENSFFGVTPYAEVSVGIAGLSYRTLANRSLGGNWAFEDLLGVGCVFGAKQQYDISLRYLHYSNANIMPPNDGIDVKLLLTLAYSFTS